MRLIRATRLFLGVTCWASRASGSVTVPPVFPSAEAREEVDTGGSPEGYPIDFVHEAMQEHPGLGEAEAVASFLRSREDGARGRLEAVQVRDLLRNPSLYASHEGVAADEHVPAAWRDVVRSRRSLLRQIVRAVGRIHAREHPTDEYDHVGSYIMGTGFLVAPDVVMTNKHVALQFARVRGDRPELAARPGRERPEVWMDFGGTREEHPIIARVESVVFVAEKHDVALLRLAAGSTDGRKPLRLQGTEPSGEWQGRKVVTCGYPCSLTVRSLKTTRVKRLSLGELLRSGPEEPLLHDCLTLPGSSGSPVVDLESGTAWGLHFRGTGIGNAAERMWEVRRLPGIVAVLGEPPAHGEVAEVVELERDAPLRVPRPTWLSDEVPQAAQHGGLPPPPAAVTTRVAASTGLVSLRGKAGEAHVVATGFVIAPGLMATLGPFRPPSAGLHVEVDFDRAGRSPPSRAPVVMEIAGDIDVGGAVVTLLRLPPDSSPTDFPPPLAAVLRRDPGTDVLVCGHPHPTSSIPAHVSAVVFGGETGMKRVAVGKIRAGAPGEVLLQHDCSTAPGDGGAPVASAADGALLGMHVGGAYLKPNYWLPIDVITGHADVRSVLEAALRSASEPVEGGTTAPEDGP